MTPQEITEIGIAFSAGALATCLLANALQALASRRKPKADTWEQVDGAIDTAMTCIVGAKLEGEARGRRIRELSITIRASETPGLYSTTLKTDFFEPEQREGMH